MNAEPGCAGGILPLFHAPGYSGAARHLASEFNIPVAGEADAPPAGAGPLILWYDAGGLSVRQTGRRAMGPVRCEFAAGGARHRRFYGGGRSQAIARAVGMGKGVRPSVADLTAGFGADAFVLAGLGCRVTLIERQAAIAALLADGLTRARQAGLEDESLAQIVARMLLVHADARDWLAETGPTPDVIYLDPMFPERRKSAQVNKTMQVFQQLVGEDPDAAELLPTALERARYRVVVKRPAKAPWLGEREPSLSMTGKSVRFDIYALRRMTA